MNNLIDEMIELKQKELLRKKKLEKLNNKYIQPNTVFLNDIYKKILVEDDDFELVVTYCVWHGFSISFDNKNTSKYHVYKVFNSFSWFHEYVSKIYNASELSSSEQWKLQIKDDLSGLKETLEEVEMYFNCEYVKQRHQSFFNFISSQVKIILESGNNGRYI